MIIEKYKYFLEIEVDSSFYSGIVEYYYNSSNDFILNPYNDGDYIGYDGRIFYLDNKLGLSYDEPLEFKHFDPYGYQYFKKHIIEEKLNELLK